MKIDSNLNLNKHPYAVKEGCLVAATNIIISKDNRVLQNEPYFTANDSLNNLIKNKVGSDYKILYILPCNKEIVLFIQLSIQNKLSLYRYSEIENAVCYCTDIEYSGGNIIGEFTYNKNNLIIAFTEYTEDDSLHIPLRTINLGEFNKNIKDNDELQLINTAIHPLCPEVTIPSLSTWIIDGSAYKGWYFIFIRFKISDNTYTQWFDTNTYTFVDDYNKEKIFDYWVLNEFINTQRENSGNTRNGKPTHPISLYNEWFYSYYSDEKDVCIKTFRLNLVDSFNTIYSKCQLGFINVTKSTTRGFKTADININDIDNYIFSNHTVESYSTVDLITTYSNYYNSKTITTKANRLYIANYTENNVDNLLDKCKNITVQIGMNFVSYDTFNGDDYVDSTIILNSYGAMPYTYYNFFIHFVDKYGQITNGINLSEFNVITINDNIKLKYNVINNLLIMYDANYNFCNTSIRYMFSVSNIPDEYVGYFISYEKVESRVKYIGVIYSPTGEDGHRPITSSHQLIYTDKLNYDDELDFDFDTLVVYNSEFIYSDQRYNELIYATLTTPISKSEYSIVSKKLYVADSYENINLSTCIEVTLNKNYSFGTKIVFLLKSDSDKLFYYNNQNKTLIPCTNVKYNTYNYVIANTKDAYISLNHAIRYGGAFYNNSVKYFQYQNNQYATERVLNYITWNAPTEVPMESLQINNMPVVTFFPVAGVNTENEYDKAFKIGNIIECKNTIDLFQQKYNNVSNSHPKSLEWYNKEINYEDKFPNTIRRSEIIQDESNENAWRKFNIENYKNINENKGNIVKIINLGTHFIVHSQYGLFLFNADDSIKSGEENAKNIQLASIDVWDIDYKEVITDRLGICGLTHEYNAISGEFGYIFYDIDAKALYRYDNNRMIRIDSDIINYINQLNGYDINITDDKQRDRLLFKFFKNTEQVVLSYNYSNECFVSTHNYKYDKGYSTKENIYIIDNDNKLLCDYSTTNKNDNFSISIIFNSDYEIMKFIEYFSYKLHKIIKRNNDVINTIDKFQDYYAGDKIRVYSQYCDTGELDITIDSNSVNKVDNFIKPYWRFGNWNINMLRDKIDKYKQSSIYPSNMTRLYGNWFVIQFIFKDTFKLVELESINVKLINGEEV